MSKRAAIVCLFLSLLGVRAATAQAVIPPAFPIYPVFGATSVFSSPDFWVSMNQYPQNLAYQPFRWIYAMGGVVPFVRTPHFALEGTSRFDFRMQPVGSNEIMFWSLDLISDLEMQAWVNVDGFSVGAAFRHNCKHDLDLYLGRLIIQDAVVLMLTHAPFSFEWGRSQTSSLFASAEAEYVLPALFPAPTQDPDRFRIDGQLHLDALQLGRGAKLFAEGGGAFTLRRTTTDVQNIEPLNFDWHARMGVEAPMAQHGASVYLQVEHLTDPWVVLSVQPVTLVSIGFAFASIAG